MNCKPDDLAVIVRDDFPENIGALVHVLRPAGEAFNFSTPTGSDVGFEWEVMPSRCLRAWNDDFTSSPSEPGEPVAFPDSCLRPLRDNPGEDETLSWAGLPKKVGEVA